MSTDALLYLRLSDYRTEGALDGREAKLRAKAADLGWTVPEGNVIIENDLAPKGNGSGPRGASAFKRQRILLPNGTSALRTVRPGFRSMLTRIMVPGGPRNVLAEDLDRLLRQPRDGEDLLDAAELGGATVKSLSGSVTLTRGGTDDERFVARIMAATANKASADTGRRVSAARDRLAGQSWQGGRRPYGFRPDPDAAQWHKTLIEVPEESAVIGWIADQLRKGTSVKWIARDLRARQVATVTGAEWSTRTVWDVVTKPAVAGYAVRNGEVVGDAPWSPILDRDVWSALVDLRSANAAKRTNTTGNEPRWLVSLFATCGVCGKPLKVGGAGRGRSAAYVGTDCGHVRRVASAVDGYVSDLVVARLEEPDVTDLLRPPARPGVDSRALRAEIRQVEERRARFTRMAAAGDIDDLDLVGILRDLRKREETLTTQLTAASDAPDPIEEFRTGRPARVVWDALPLSRKRAVVQLLIGSIVIERAAGRGHRFDPSTVVVTWRSQD